MMTDNLIFTIELWLWSEEFQAEIFVPIRVKAVSYEIARAAASSIAQKMAANLELISFGDHTG